MYKSRNKLLTKQTAVSKKLNSRSLNYFKTAANRVFKATGNNATATVTTYLQRQAVILFTNICVRDYVGNSATSLCLPRTH
jgi:hypothetical protein